MTKQKGSSRSFLLVGLVIILILAVALIRLDKRTAAMELVEETPTVVVSKPKPVEVKPALPVAYTNTKLEYSLTIPVGTRTSIENGNGKVYADPVPSNVGGVYIEKGDMYVTVSDQAYPFGMGVTTKRSNGTAVIDGKTYRTTNWTDGTAIFKETVFVKDDLFISYGYNSATNKATLDAFVKPILASIDIK